MGVPAYGYTSVSNATSLRTRSASRLPRRGLPRSFGSDFETTQEAMISVTNDDGNTGNGQVQFRQLVSQGALTRNTPDADGDIHGPLYIGGGGFTRYWDECSSTPFLRSESAGQVITYDDPESLSMKADFVKQMGMLGVNMFDVHGDTDAWDLIDSVRNGLKLE